VRESGRAGDELPMREFEALTLVPFDLRLLDKTLMTQGEIDWLNNYHRQVAETVGPLLQGSDREWLEQATRAA